MGPQNDFWDYGIAFFAVVGVCLSIRLLIKHFFSISKEKEYISNYNDGGNRFEEELIRQGYIFCTLFRVTDIVSIARAMGFSLTMEQVALIVKSVKKEFNVHRGIDSYRIQTHIRMVLKQQQYKP